MTIIMLPLINTYVGKTKFVNAKNICEIKYKMKNNEAVVLVKVEVLSY